MAVEIADKVFELTEQFNRYVFDNPEILDVVPDKATLVFLDADDPAFNEANIELARSTPRAPGSQQVYVKMQKRVRIVEQIKWEASILQSPSPV